jgi:hypothetical protein
VSIERLRGVARYNPKRSPTKRKPTSTAKLRVDVAHLSSDLRYSNALPLRLRAEHFRCQHFSGASAFLVSALFWCQRLSGVSPFLVPAPFWCQPFSGASTFLVPALFWCRRFSGASPILGASLIGAYFWFSCPVMPSANSHNHSLGTNHGPDRNRRVPKPGP